MRVVASHLSDWRVEKIRELRRKGIGVEAIAHMIGCYRDAVRAVVAEIERTRDATRGSGVIAPRPYYRGMRWGAGE